MEFFNATHPDSFSKLDMSQCSLVMPAISVGNVGQLATDILISTTLAENLGVIYDESLLPMIGNDPYTNGDTNNSCKLSSSCDVYHAKAENLVIIQQRATFVKGKRKMYRDKLIKWIKEMKFAKVVLLSSTYSHIRTDQQLAGSQFRYLATSKAKENCKTDNSWTELEDTSDEFGRMSKNLPGSGITKTLYTDCSEKDVPLIVVLMFCSEGDNAPDALRMIDFANNTLNVINIKPRSSLEELKQAWKIPKSWNLNFGNTYNRLIY